MYVYECMCMTPEERNASVLECHVIWVRIVVVNAIGYVGLSCGYELLNPFAWWMYLACGLRIWRA